MKARWLPGGAFCGCGQVEFMVPGPACARTHDGAAILHTPVECRLATSKELANLDPLDPAAPPDSRDPGGIGEGAI